MHACSFFRDLIWNDTGYARAGTFVRVLKSTRCEHSAVSALVWFAPASEMKLMCVSETSPAWCACKDVLRLNKCTFLVKKKRERISSYEHGGQPYVPALTALNNVNTLNWKKCITCVNALILTALIIIFPLIYCAILIQALHSKEKCCLS